MENLENKNIEIIESVFPNQITIKFTHNNFDRPFLLIAIKGSHQKLLIYDELFNMTKVGEILYAIRGHKVYISSFEVNEDYQQNGIGRLLFNLAATHGDIENATFIYGDADPINNIKGVSGQEGVTFEDEQQAIFKIYQKLGCTVNPETHGFYQVWKLGEKTKQASPLVLEIANILAEKDGFSLTDQNQPQ